MGKDVFWFRHDSNASRDLKLMKIKTIYDFWGVGVYWTIIEFLREQENYKYEYSESNMQLLCGVINCKDLEKFNNLVKDSVKFGLFIIDTHFYSNSLINRMSKWESCKENGNKGGRPKLIKTQLKPKQNPNKTIREDNIIEDNNKKENIYLEHFHLKLLKTEYEKLIVDFSKNEVDLMIEKIQAYSKDYLKKYSSFNLIIRNWIKKNPENKTVTFSEKLFGNA